MTDPDRALWDQLDSSVLGRVRAGVAAPWRRAWHSSAAASWVTRTRDAWISTDVAVRWRVPGVTIAVAALTHGLLQLTVRPVGWWWTIVPAVALTFGLAVWLLSFTVTRHHE